MTYLSCYRVQYTFDEEKPFAWKGHYGLFQEVTAACQCFKIGGRFDYGSYITDEAVINRSNHRPVTHIRVTRDRDGSKLNFENERVYNQREMRCIARS